MTDTSKRSAAPSPLGYVAAGVGMVLMVVAFPFFLSSGLLAPLWAVVGLVVVWVVLFVLGLRWFRTRPYWVLLLPAVAIGIWFATLYAGEAWLGWRG